MKFAIIPVLIILFISLAAGQSPHDHHPPAKPTPTPTPHHHPPAPAARPSPTPAEHKHDAPASSEAKAQTPGHAEHSKQMSSTIDIADPMNREGSGTSWLPDSSPMYAWSKMYGDGGMLMLMGTQFLRYTQIGSSRDVSAAGKGGRSRFDAPNMFMAMYSRPLTN